MSDTKTPPGFVRFRRDADGTLHYEARLRPGDDETTLSIVYWQDRGIEAIFEAADRMRREASAWRNAKRAVRLP